MKTCFKSQTVVAVFRGDRLPRLVIIWQIGQLSLLSRASKGHYRDISHSVKYHWKYARFLHLTIPSSFQTLACCNNYYRVRDLTESIGDQMKTTSLTALKKVQLFDEASKFLSGSNSMFAAIKYLSVLLEKYLPMTAVMMHISPKDEPIVGRMVWAERQYLVRSLTNYKLNLEGWKAWQRIHQSGGGIRNNVEDIPQSQVFFPNVWAGSVTFIGVCLKLTPGYWGGLAVLSSEKAYYTEEHLDFLESLGPLVNDFLLNQLQAGELESVDEATNSECLCDYGSWFRKQQLVGAESGLKNVVEQARMAARTDTSVLIQGETGTGKELIARFIHETSARRKAPFLAVNCGALPVNLIDSELFGHEKGAFTGAGGRHEGFFEQADRGSILLDEIGELPKEQQVRFLRVLQTKEIKRLGGKPGIPVDIRVISATNRCIGTAVQSGGFRKDLFFRLNVFPIHLPPLRDRKEDIPELVHAFIMRLVHDWDIEYIPYVSSFEIDKLLNYSWPGNVRELENVVERALVNGIDNGQLVFNELKPRKSVETDLLPDVFSNLTEPGLLKRDWMTLDDIMSMYIKQVLSATQGRIQGRGGAAEILGIKPSTLRSRMLKLRIPFRRSLVHLY
jgi:transcriptional regulator with GAF, ATPase, and Fis domain